MIMERDKIRYCDICDKVYAVRMVADDHVFASLWAEYEGNSDPIEIDLCLHHATFAQVYHYVNTVNPLVKIPETGEEMPIVAIQLEIPLSLIRKQELTVE